MGHDGRVHADRSGRYTAVTPAFRIGLTAALWDLRTPAAPDAVPLPSRTASRRSPQAEAYLVSSSRWVAENVPA